MNLVNDPDLAGSRKIMLGYIAVNNVSPNGNDSSIH